MSGPRKPTSAFPKDRFDEPKYCLVGTAGHIDHGKSALVRELTGTDPDRLQEEKDRGITIDLGFAHMSMGDGLHVGFVDVPGHERFLKNMLAGIGGIDAVMLVVAADESIMPQTREHFAICKLLGIRDGMVAITKCDLVDEEIADLVELEVRELLADTPLSEAAIVRTSIETGLGLEDVQTELSALLSRAPDRPAEGLLRLPVDRVFTVRGFGTVVTGTLLSGTARVGDDIEILPSGTRSTIRGLQVHASGVETARAGQRTAVNLQGIDVHSVARGDLLVSPGMMRTSHLIDARLQLLDEFGPVVQHQRLRFHHGAAEYSPMVTIGGGVVIDALPRKHRRSEEETVSRLRDLLGAAPAEQLVAWVVAAGPGGMSGDELRAKLVLPTARVEQLATDAIASESVVQARGKPLLLVAPDHFSALGGRLLDALASYHELNPLRQGMPMRAARSELARSTRDEIFDALVETLQRDGKAKVSGDHLSLAGHEVLLSPEQTAVRETMLQTFLTAGLAPPAPEEATGASGAPPSEAESMLYHLVREGVLIRVRDDMIFHATALEDLVQLIRERRAVGEQFSVPEFKEWTGTSRKHAIPLLEYLDQRRITRRVGDSRELL
jgi:selenocysteine-specific elongation factor